MSNEGGLGMRLWKRLNGSGLPQPMTPNTIQDKQNHSSGHGCEVGYTCNLIRAMSKVCLKATKEETPPVKSGSGLG